MLSCENHIPKLIKFSISLIYYRVIIERLHYPLWTFQVKILQIWNKLTALKAERMFRFPCENPNCNSHFNRVMNVSLSTPKIESWSRLRQESQSWVHLRQRLQATIPAQRLSMLHKHQKSGALIFLTLSNTCPNHLPGTETREFNANFEFFPDKMSHQNNYNIFCSLNFQCKFLIACSSL